LFTYLILHLFQVVNCTSLITPVLFVSMKFIEEDKFARTEALYCISVYKRVQLTDATERCIN